MPNTAMDHAAILNDDKLVDSCAPRKAGGKLPIVNGNADQWDSAKAGENVPKIKDAEYFFCQFKCQSRLRETNTLVKR